MSNFNIHNYRQLLQDFIKLDYQFKDFSNYDPAKPHLLLRHDIDYDPALALPLAEIDHELRICSIYYVLIRSEFYNVSEPRHVMNLKNIVKLGHKVGLHFDASLYPDDFEILNEKCAYECDLLENVINEKIEDISLHRPSKKLLGYKKSLGGRRHSYQPRFFSEIGYCSDSRGSFRFGHPLEQAAVKESKALQLVLHPIWWCEAQSDTPVDRLSRFLKNNFEQKKLAMANNSSVYKNYQENSMRLKK